MTSTIQVGTKGLPVLVTVQDKDGAAVDITGSDVEFVFEGPDYEDIEVTGTIHDAEAGIAKYVLVPADGVGEIEGVWRFQVYLNLPGGWEGPTPVGEFTALGNLIP